uniref:Cathepsin propeptide inhibitor domain-containing protein n=1 Tax=Oryza nivara TaxID=4536 RepID=A0A0E0HG23_ORYNI
MSLRAIGYLLTRSRRGFSPRGIPRAQAESSLGILTRAGRPAAHSFHSVRLSSHPVLKSKIFSFVHSQLICLSSRYAIQMGFAVGGGSVVVATASLVGLAATILCFKQNTDKSGAREEDKEEVTKKLPAAQDAGKEPYLSKEAAIEAGFVDKDGKILWSSYLNYVEHGKTLPDDEAFAKEARDYQEAIKKQEVKVDEATMKARFHDLMKEYGRSYSTEEEKARRYEVFKEATLWADKVNALEPRTIPYGPNGYADFTDEEFKRMHCHCSAIDWERYIDELNTMAARGWTYFRDPDATTNARLGARHKTSRSLHTRLAPGDTPQLCELFWIDGHNVPFINVRET